MDQCQNPVRSGYVPAQGENLPRPEQPAVSLKAAQPIPVPKSDHEDPAVGQVFDGGFSEKRAIHIIFQKDRKLGPFV